eukprot:178779-Amphidinium_carterae.1
MSERERDITGGNGKMLEHWTWCTLNLMQFVLKPKQTMCFVFCGQDGTFVLEVHPEHWSECVLQCSIADLPDLNSSPTCWTMR